MALPAHVLLIGLRAAGKSTLARRLSAALGGDAIDLDDETRRVLGFASVREAFAAVGETRFREAESSALARVLAGPASIVALGGGTPTAPGAATLLAEARAQGRACIVFLDPPLSALAARLAADAGDRPSLTGRGVVEEIAELASRRRPLYGELADIVIATTTESEEEVQAVAAAVRERFARVRAD